MPARQKTGPLLRALNEALTAARLPDSPTAGAAVELARTYARLIDSASEVAAAASALATPEDGNDRQALDAIRRRMSAQDAVAQLGPKLLDVLRGLNLDRPGKADPANSEGTPDDPTVRKLAELRARSDQRLARHAMAPPPPPRG